MRASRVLPVLALGVTLFLSAPVSGWATAQEEAATGSDITLDAFSLLSTQQTDEPILISEATPAPYIASQVTDVAGRQVAMISGYISHYNKKLAWDEVETIAQAIIQFSSRYGIDYRLLTSVIAVESSFRKDVVSSSGAIGMGQLKPDTAKWLGVTNPYDPVDNIAGTARFLAWLVKRYNGNLESALSAYYQGPGNVDRKGITPVCLPYLEKINRALGGLL